MYNPTLGYTLLAILIVVVVSVVWLHWRYARYLKIKRSGTGKKPKPVRKPFWIK